MISTKFAWCGPLYQTVISVNWDEETKVTALWYKILNRFDYRWYRNIGDSPHPFWANHEGELSLNVPSIYDSIYEPPHGKTSKMCVFVFGLNVAFNNFSVISRRCLVATGSSMLTFIVLPHWSIMSQTLDMIPHPVTLSWHWVDQS